MKVNIKNLSGSKYEKVKEFYSYLYDLGNVMFKYYSGAELLSQEEINMIVNSSAEEKIDGMYLAASDNNKIKYSYSTFLRNSNNIKLARKKK